MHGWENFGSNEFIIGYSSTILEHKCFDLYNLIQESSQIGLSCQYIRYLQNPILVDTISSNINFKNKKC